jgi:hypothetical protein
MSKLSTAAKRKHATLIIPQQLEIVRIFESSKGHRKGKASYNIRPSSIYDIKKPQKQLQLLMASSKSVKGLFKQQTLKQPKLVQMNKVVHKWFTAMCSKGKPMSGTVIIEKGESFYDETKITDKCTFSEGWLQKLDIV